MRKLLTERERYLVNLIRPHYDYKSFSLRKDAPKEIRLALEELKKIDEERGHQTCE